MRGATRHQSDAGVQIYEAQYAHHDNIIIIIIAYARMPSSGRAIGLSVILSVYRTKVWEPGPLGMCSVRALLVTVFK